jgi:HEPN domain-containing protein
MGPHEEAKRRIVAEWLHKADADIDLARHLLAEDALFPGAIAFHSQQAAEKYLKGFLAWHQVPFPKTHDLQELLDLVEKIEFELAVSLRDVIVLTPHGVDARYPTDRPDASPEEAREAVELAGMLRDSIRNRLEGFH